MIVRKSNFSYCNEGMAIDMVHEILGGGLEMACQLQQNYSYDKCFCCCFLPCFLPASLQSST